MEPLQATDLLALWERGRARHALDRGALLAAWARPELPVESVADLPLGDITRAALQVHAATFGARLRAHVDCASCGQRLEMNLPVGELLQPGPAAAAVAVAGRGLRPPSLRDLAAVAHERDAGRAARLLLERCLVSSRPGEVQAWSDAELAPFEEALEEVDPNADLAFEVRCPACGHAGCAQLDAAELLWDEIELRARELLGEVHVLASAYGWTEGEILGLSPARRAAYLSMAGA